MKTDTDQKAGHTISANENIGAVIVAAGLSSRMGEYKPLMEIGGETIARRVIGAFACAGVQPIVIVTGHKAEDLEAHLREYTRLYAETHPQESIDAHTEALYRGDETTGDSPCSLHFIRNETYQTTPMFESAKIGLSYILNKCARTFFCPIDVPLFTADTVRKLMACEAPVVKPTYKGKEGHPILIGAELIPEIIDIRRTRKSATRPESEPETVSEDGMKGALAKFENVTERVAVSDEGILYDADTPEDIIRLIELL